MNSCLWNTDNKTVKSYTIVEPVSYCMYCCCLLNGHPLFNVHGFYYVTYLRSYTISFVFYRQPWAKYFIKSAIIVSLDLMNVTDVHRTIACNYMSCQKQLMCYYGNRRILTWIPKHIVTKIWTNMCSCL